MSAYKTTDKATQSFDIYHDLWIDASQERVFQAESEPSHLINWWPLKCTGEPTLNTVYNFYFGPEYDWYGKVNRLQKNRHFSIKMQKAMPDWRPTTFGFEISEDKGKTKLSFFHKAWPAANDHFKMASFC